MPERLRVLPQRVDRRVDQADVLQPDDIEAVRHVSDAQPLVSLQNCLVLRLRVGAHRNEALLACRRGLSQGRATCTIEPHSYGPAPADVLESFL